MTFNRVKAESGIQLLARLTKKPGIEMFYPDIFGKGPKHDEFIELYSQGSSTILLIDLLCQAIIPKVLNGPEAGVIVFNTDGNLDFNDIISVLKKKVTERVNRTDEFSLHNNNVEILVNSVLNNIHVMEIFDVTQFYITIQNLENFLTMHPNISLVVFHTLTAFYWSEQGFKITKMDSYLKKLLNIIQKVIKNHKVTVLYSKPEYFNSNKGSFDILDPVCKVTDKYVNYHIQIIYNNHGGNLVKVKTCDNQFQKEFNVINDEIVWSLL